MIVVACVAMVACTPSVPSRYIQPSDMEDILCDFHVSQAMANQNGKSEDERSYLKTLYFAAVLEKHGVTKADFDSSLVYYYVRADRFSDIYKRVAEKLSDQAMDLGAADGEVNRFANLNAGGDTTDIWVGNISTILIPYAPYNVYSFVQKADTSFRKGDSFMLILNTDFIYQNGMRNAEACLALRYDNDSVISRATGLSATGVNQLRIPANGNHMAKEIRGFIYLTPEKEETSTLKLMFIRGIQLIKFRKKETTEVVFNDSIKQVREEDEAPKSEQERELKPE